MTEDAAPFQVDRGTAFDLVVKFDSSSSVDFERIAAPACLKCNRAVKRSRIATKTWLEAGPCGSRRRMRERSTRSMRFFGIRLRSMGPAIR